MTVHARLTTLLRQLRTLAVSEVLPPTTLTLICRILTCDLDVRPELARGEREELQRASLLPSPLSERDCDPGVALASFDALVRCFKSINLSS